MPEPPVSAPPAPVPSGSEAGPAPGSFPDLGRFWTAANVLSMSRIFLVPPIAWLVYQGGPALWIIALALVAVATDYFDGRVARATGTVSEWGKVLDPIADKFAAAAVTLALVVRPEAHGPTLPVWFVVAVVLRDVLIAAGGVVVTRRLGFVLMSLWSGKVAVGLLAATVLSVLFGAPVMVREGLVALTTAALAYSFACYLWRYVQVMRLGPAILLDERHNVVRERLPPRGGRPSS